MRRMNPIAAPFISHHRLARLTAWAGLWLQAFAAMLLTFSAADTPAARHALARMARFVADLVTLRAAMRPPPRCRRPRWRAPVVRAGLHRTFIGASLRKRLRGRDPVTRFFAILRVMRDFDTLVARQTKRLANGLTRLRPILPMRDCACTDAVSLAAPSATVDSS